MDATAVLAVFCAAACGCSGAVEATEPQEHVGRSIQPIVNGTTSGTDHDAVVLLARYDDFGKRAGLCTATAIAPNLLVTARHCVSAADSTAACSPSGEPVSGGMLHGDRAPSSLAVFAPVGGVAPVTTVDLGATARVKALVVDPATTVCNKDIAFVILDRAITTPIAPIRLAPPVRAEILTAVGWGITEQGQLPTSRMQRRNVPLVGTGPMPYPEDARFGAGDAEFLVGESVCSGDSGSPALAASGAVIGVASRAGNGQPRDPNNAASTCVGATAHVVYAQLGSATALALRAFKEAGATPWLEGQPDPRTANDASRALEDGVELAHEPARPSSPADTMAAAIAMGADEPSMTTGGSGCSASGEPTRGAVERALGFVAAIAMVMRLRRRRPSSRRSHPPVKRSSQF